MKNEHIVYAYAPLIGGSNLLLVGITDIGWEYLGKENGNYLHANPPSKEFSNVREVWIVRAKNKKEIHDMMQTVAKQMGINLTTPS
jgi:hypothetical protein